jgi:hypothetical protein
MQNVDAESDSVRSELRINGYTKIFPNSSDSQFGEIKKELEFQSTISTLSNRHKEFLNELQRMRNSLRDKDIEIFTLKSLVFKREQDLETLKLEVSNLNLFQYILS